MADQEPSPAEEALNPEAEARNLAQPIDRLRWDWWRCLRLGGISGRYWGEMTAPDAGKYALDLRVDVDWRQANSPVLNKVSADLHQAYAWRWWGHTYKWYVYKRSWIVHNPTVSFSRCSAKITGAVSFWKGRWVFTNVEIDIPWTSSSIGPATVRVFSSFVAQSETYSCAFKSKAFREVKVEVDVCKSVNSAPLLPTYDTHSRTDRPAATPQRMLKIETAYMEAGIDVDIDPAHSVIDDSAAAFNSWSDAELHDAMEQYFSKYPGSWPKWHMWCLLAGKYDMSSVAGIMFDYGTAYGGPGRAPERQGCAVFRKHSWFNNLVANPSTAAQHAAMRQYLYTYVHEMGHAFNFVHSWNKGRPNALSWMNYPQYVSGFWNNFMFRFDDPELIHLRHGDRVAVIMGGDPWATGSHLEGGAEAMAEQLGEAPVELLLRAKPYYHFMEPVEVELRLRNLTDLPASLNTELNPDFGNVAVYIRRPDGSIVEHAPIACKMAEPALTELRPANGAEGEDRHSQGIQLSYGAAGHNFDQPGQYLVRAVYQGDGDLQVVSPTCRLRIGQPFSVDEERLAQDYFSHDSGLALYLGGTASEQLSTGMDTLREVADRFAKTPVGAQVAMALARNEGRSFFGIVKNKLVEKRKADPKAALGLCNKALAQHKRDDSTFTNLGRHALSRVRAEVMSAMGDTAGAKQELRGLVTELRKKGVNKPVLDRIRAYARKI